MKEKVLYKERLIEEEKQRTNNKSRHLKSLINQRYQKLSRSIK